MGNLANNPSYLRRRHKVWYGRIAIPMALRESYGGKTVIEESLRTRDHTQALMKLGAWLAGKRGEFERVGSELERKASLRQLDDDDIDRLRLWRMNQSYDWMMEQPWNAEKLIEKRLLSHLIDDCNFDEIAADLEADGIRPDDESIGRASFAYVDGDQGALELYRNGQQPVRYEGSQAGTRVPDHLEDYLAKAHAKPKTRQEYRTMITRFAGWLDDQSHIGGVEAVTHNLAGDYILHLDEVLARKTIRKHQTALSSYWAWLAQSKRATGLKPGIWKDHPFPKDAAKETASKLSKRAFNDDEVATLLTGITEQPLADFIRVAALSGMRQSEIANLTVSDCREGHFQIRSGKTASAKRLIPIHSELLDIVARRCEGKAEGDWLFDELAQGSDLRSRGAAIGQQFGRVRKQLGIHDQSDDLKKSRVDFHSFRRWFSHQLEKAGVDELHAARLLGHKITTMSYGLYSDGADMVQLKKAIEKVKLPV